MEGRSIVLVGLLVLSIAFIARWLSPPHPPARASAKPSLDASTVEAAQPDRADVSQVSGESARSPAPVPGQLAHTTPKASELVSEVGVIRGRVVNDRAEPLEGARVFAVLQVDAEDDPPTPVAVSDVTGGFTLSGFTSAGEYELKAELDGWWQVSTILCPTGATDAELVLQRGGGIRGQVIEALDTTVDDYIVVVRYEHPPVEWTPERKARVQRSLEREMQQMMRQELANRMRTQILMQELGIESKPGQRPDGEAWTLLEPDGSFELSKLRPGMASVIIAARNRTRGLVTVKGVEVLPDAVAVDARLNPVRMNEFACVYRMAITDPEGAAVPAGSLVVLPVEKDGHGEFTIKFKDGAAAFVGPLWIDLLTVAGDGFAPLVLRGPLQALRVTLYRAEAVAPGD